MLIPRSALAARKCCDADSRRYALGGIYFTRNDAGAPLAVATDGRKLVALTWQEPCDVATGAADHPASADLDLSARLGSSDGIIVPAAACDQLAKCKIGEKSRRESLRHFALEEPADPAANSVRIAACDGDQSANFTPKLQEGRFPSWRDVIPAPRADSINFELDGKQLVVLLESILAHAGNESNSVTFSIVADRPFTSAVTITAARADGNKAVGVIMPLYSEKKNGKPVRPVNQWQAEPEADEPEAEPAPVIDQPAAEPEPEPEATPAPTPRPRRRRSAAVAADAWEAANY